MSSSNQRLAIVAAVTAVFLGVSLLSVPVPGVNEPHYLCKARAFADPNWCSRDFFLQSGNAHAVFFAATGWLPEFLPLAMVAIVGRTLCCVLLACGWTELSRRLGLGPRQTLAAAGLFAAISQTGNFSGEWTIGGFESKVPAYGFALIAVATWAGLRDANISDDQASVGRAALCGAVLGISVALHPVVGIWFFIAITMSESAILVAARIASRPLHAARTGVLLLAALVTSLPGLVPAVGMLTTDAVPRSDRQTADFIQVFSRLAHHLDPSTFPAIAWIHTAILSAIVVAGSTLLLRRSRDVDGSRSAWHRWLLLLTASAIIAAVGVAVGWHTVPATELENWQMRAFLLKFYPFRLFDGLLPMSAALVMARCAGRLVSAIGVQRVVVEQSAEHPFSAVPKTSTTTADRTLTGLTTAVCLLAFVLSATGRAASPAGYDSEQFAAWLDICDWIRRNTEPDALVFTPRESFGFKWYAERAEYVCYKDCPQDAAGILEWNRRLWAIHDWAQSSFQDGAFDVADLQRLRTQTGITHLLTRKLHPFTTEPLYANGIWRVYALPQ
ncbi:MAG: DUF6798 domain-containing protein [Planctomycetaceae bacterium]